jgi:excisionase family DNA binding protein
MKIYKITEASEYLGVSINTLKTLANNGKVKSFKTTGEHRRFRQEDLDAYMGVEKEKQEKLTVIYARCSTAKQKENLERIVRAQPVRRRSKVADNREQVLDLITQYGGIDGAHHKQWLLDQIVRILTGDGYENWVAEYQDGEDGPETYEWDEGIAP